MSDTLCQSLQSDECSTLDPFYRGDTVVWDVQFQDEETGDPINIANFKLTYTMKRDPDLPVQPGDLSHAVIFPDTPDSHEGRGQFRIEATMTEQLIPTVYEYDFQLTTDTGEVRTLAKGTVRVLQDITDP